MLFVLHPECQSTRMVGGVYQSVSRRKRRVQYAITLTTIHSRTKRNKHQQGLQTDQ